MFISNLDNLYFSQSALSIYQKCPLKFRYRYLDSLYWPRDWAGNAEQREFIEKGQLFHQLARRYYARGESITGELLTGELRDWFMELKKFRPFNEGDYFYPEYELRTNRGDLKLMARFDLLYLDRNSGELIIYDWKTNKRPFPEKWDFENDMQTIVYLYVLQEGVLGYFPFTEMEIRELRLIYWNPRFPGDKKCVLYSQERFSKDRDFLGGIIREIKALEYDEFRGIDYEKTCRYCEYRPVCYGKKPELLEIEEEDLELDLDWEAIDEIEF
ncbi:MAG: PD-(D/E)XK nuclease family protein [Halanaerobiaceae bacterium]|jgi:CRISPR/Cas system-associated exonuclease Cas4 (RecB family)|nr:PD-(D/E)XK nuclease family protein [Halanaerobiaceae bacterium]